jgi:hypothetical protein
MYLEERHFKPILHLHDRFQFRTLRESIARGAETLAHEYMTAPALTLRPRAIGEEFLERTFRFGTTNGGRISALADLFRPWTGWWEGRWSSGTTCHSVWDATATKDGRQIQLVSETTGPEHAHAQSWARFRSTTHNQTRTDLPFVDLALHAWDAQRGVTAWISRANMEMPHVGYMLDPNMVIWVAQIGADSARYVMYVERCAGPTYSMHGMEFSYNGRKFLRCGGDFQATYTASAPTW